MTALIESGGLQAQPTKDAIRTALRCSPARARVLHADLSGIGPDHGERVDAALSRGRASIEDGLEQITDVQDDAQGSADEAVRVLEAVA